MPKYKVIVNPASGRGSGGRAIPLIEDRLRSIGLDYDLARTERPWHAADLAQAAAAEGCEVVVAAGGDGTANEVLNGLMRAKHEGNGGAAMGVLCIGRGNDFAYGVGIPTDLEAGIKVLAQGKRREIDIGVATGGLYLQGRYFGNGVGIGFDAVVGLRR